MTPSSLLALEGKLVEAKGPDQSMILRDLLDAVNVRDFPLWERLSNYIGVDAFESAVLAMVEYALPGWSWSLQRFPSIRAQLAQPVQTEFGRAIGVRSDCSGDTPALAMGLALVRALKGAGE